MEVYQYKLDILHCKSKSTLLQIIFSQFVSLADKFHVSSHYLQNFICKTNVHVLRTFEQVHICIFFNLIAHFSENIRFWTYIYVLESEIGTRKQSCRIYPASFRRNNTFVRVTDDLGRWRCKNWFFIVIFNAVPLSYARVLDHKSRNDYSIIGFSVHAFSSIQNDLLIIADSGEFTPCNVCIWLAYLTAVSTHYITRD